MPLRRIRRSRHVPHNATASQASGAVEQNPNQWFRFSSTPEPGGEGGEFREAVGGTAMFTGSATGEEEAGSTLDGFHLRPPEEREGLPIFTTCVFPV